MAIQYVDDLFKKDMETALAAVKNEVKSIRFLDDSLKNDDAFLIQAIKLNPVTVVSVIKKGKDKDKEFFAKVISTLNEASDSNNAHAQFMLGILHFQGIGVVKDKSISINFLKQSSNNGLKEATELLKELNK